MSGSKATLRAEDWFEMVVGCAERPWLPSRGTSLVELPPVDGDARLGPHLGVKNLKKGEVWDAGAFRAWQYSELVAAVDTDVAGRTGPSAVGGGGGDGSTDGGAGCVGGGEAGAVSGGGGSSLGSPAPVRPRRSVPCRVEVHCRRSWASDVGPVEVSRLQATVKPGQRVMFQVGVLLGRGF
jgi:hypothetical protein